MIIRSPMVKLLLPLLFCSVLTTYAQSFSGVVTDEQGNPLHGVNVGLRSLHRYTATDSLGAYRFSGLRRGSYTLEFSHVGYKNETAEATADEGNREINVTMHSTPIEFRSVTVTATSEPTDAYDSPQPVSAVGAGDLDRSRGESLMRSVEMIPGVSMSSGGPQSMKPIVRGLGYQRVVVAENGLRHEFQQWDDDQTPEIDILDVERIEVLRGPNSIMFGSDALGGVVNVIQPDPLAREDMPGTLGGTAVFNGFSNTSQAAGSLALSGWHGAAGYRLQLGLRDAGDVTTPAGPLQNTRERETNGKAMVGFRGDWGEAAVDYSHFGQKLEILPDPSADNEPAPFQIITHDRLSARFNRPLPWARLETRAALQREEEKEYDDGEFSPLGPNLVLTSLTFDAKVHHDPLGSLFGTAGVSLSEEQNDSRGSEALIPNFQQFTAAGYLQEEALLSGVNLSAGLRFDSRRLHADDSPDLGVQEQNRSYGALTGSLGAVWHATGALIIAANLGRGWRAPIAPELFINGIDQGGQRYKVGNPDLQTEASLNIDLSIRLATPETRSELSVFRNQVNDFVYLVPSGGIDSASDLPVYFTRQANARLWGIELGSEIAFTKHLMLETAADMVIGTNTETGAWLTQIAAPRIDLGIRLTEPSFGPVGNPYAEVHSKIVFDQNRVSDFETRTGGYTLIRIGAGGEIGLGSGPLKIDCAVDNLFDRAYVNHLSRHKNFGLDPGRDITIRASVPFTIIP